MRLILYGSPAVDHISILVQNRNGRNVLPLIGGIKFQYLIRGYKTVRCGNLFYIISSKRQVQGKVCLSFFIACDLL